MTSLQDGGPIPRIDRASELRRDTDRLMTALDAPETVLVPVFAGQHLVRMQPAPRAVLPTARDASVLVDHAGEIVWLGRLAGRDCFALDLSGREPSEAPALAGSGDLVDLRFAGGLLPAEETELLAYARGMLHWHARHRFCGSCGAPTNPREGGHVRECSLCNAKHFPRTDPAIMALVVRGDRCVLARQPGFPSGVYAAVAGFVEPGESIEDAARREVKEELGLEVENLRYFRSQPWPFPSSLMLGFFGEATSDELSVDRTELEDARWFSRAELENPAGFSYPPAYSLAHYMIREFLERG